MKNCVKKRIYDITKALKMDYTTYEKVRSLPLWLQYAIGVSAILNVISVTYIRFYPPVQNINIKAEEKHDPNAVNISEIFSKALKFETVAERQDFLEKYIKQPIYGNGTIKEISRSQNQFILEINTEPLSIICPQEKNDENQRKFLLLKGKTVNFIGIFTYQKYFGYEGLTIDNCVLQE